MHSPLGYFYLCSQAIQLTSHESTMPKCIDQALVIFESHIQELDDNNILMHQYYAIPHNFDAWFTISMGAETVNLQPHSSPRPSC